MSTRLNGAATSAAAPARTRRAKAPAKPRAALSFTTLDDKQLKEQRIPLFEVDGVEYTMPAVVPMAYAISILAVVRQQQDAIGRGLYLVRELAGAEALTALLVSDVDEDSWAALIDTMWPHCFGQLEGLTTGN